MGLSKREFSKLSVLLLESSGPMRSAIFYMLRDLGVDSLVVQSVGKAVLETIEHNSFDIVLLGHNGRDATTGIQLLEEARYRGFMRATASWILMTSDASQEVILQAIDSHPDDVMTKPFSREELEKRISNLVVCKRSLSQVEQAQSRGDLKGVILACKKIGRTDPAYHDAMLIRSQALIELGEAPAAVQILEKYYFEEPNKELGVALCQAYIALHRLDDAESLLGQLVAAYPLFMQAYDLLARVQELQGELEEACETLQMATAQAPLGFPRQMELGRVASQNSAFDLARSAYKRSISLAPYSFFHSPEPHLKLANIARLQLKSSSESARESLASEIRQTLDQAQKQFPKDEALQVRSQLLLNETFVELGDMEAAAKALSRADMINSGLKRPLDLNREKQLFNHDPVPVLEPVKLAEPASANDLPKRDPEMSSKVNRIGIKHYLAGKAAQAIRYFGMATEYDPSNAHAFINLAQLFLESARDDMNRRDERLRMVDRYLRLTERMKFGSEALERQNRLKFLREQPVEKLPKGPLGMLLH